MVNTLTINHYQPLRALQSPATTATTATAATIERNNSQQSTKQQRHGATINSNSEQTINQTNSGIKHHGQQQRLMVTIFEEIWASIFNVLKVHFMSRWMDGSMDLDQLYGTRLMVCYSILKGIHMLQKFNPSSTAGEFPHTQ
jgi:hypothetical protein